MAFEKVRSLVVRVYGYAGAWLSGHERAFLVALFIAALAIRLGYIVVVVGLNSAPEYDGISYDLLARNLITGSGFSLEDAPTAFRPPGYPLFLAGAYALFGPILAVPRLLDPFLGAALVAVTWAVARSLFKNSRVALLAAVAVALHPVLVYLSGRILSEPLAILLAMLVVWIMVSSPPRLGARRALGLSFLLAALVLVRPGALLFALCVLLWLLAFSGTRQAARNAAICAATLGLVLGCWAVRNHSQFGAFIPLATEGGVTFWSGNNALSTGGAVEPSPATWPGSDPPAGLRGWPGLSEKASEDRFYAAAWDWIRAHPGDWLALLPRKVLRTWSLAFGSEAKPSGLPGWISWAYLAFPLLALAGLVLSRAHWRRLLPVYFLILSSTLVVMVFYGSTRQSAILIPCVSILAAFAVEKLMV